MFRQSRYTGLLLVGAAGLFGYATTSGGQPPGGGQPGATPAAEKAPPPGSPAATRTLDGNYLPNPSPAFGGTVNLNAVDSKPYWPANTVPPKGAPNVLLIMTDDVGF